MNLSQCRACAGTDLEMHSKFEGFPIHLWPLRRPHLEDHPHSIEPLGLYVCSLCGHIQLQEMTESFVSSLYAEGYPVEDDTPQKKKRLELLKNQLGSDFFKGKRVLDVGGGNNPFTGFIPESERWVVDIDSSVLNLKGESAENVVVGDFGSLELPTEHFDVVTAFHVMEHFRWPLEAVKKMSEILSPAGRVLVEVPHFTVVAKERPFYGVFHQHQSMYTENSLNTLFSQYGFEREHLIRNDDILLAVYRKGKLTKPQCFFEDNMEELSTYRRRLESLKGKLQESAFLNADLSLGFYGAGGSTTLFLAHFPFLKKRILKAFDRDTRKQERYIPGTGISVYSPEQVARSNDLHGLLFLSTAAYEAMAPEFSGESFDLSSLF